MLNSGLYQSIIGTIRKIGLINIIIILCLFVLPFVYYKRAEVAYEVPRVCFFNRVIEVLIIISLLSIKKIEKFSIDSTLILFIFAFLFLAILTSIFGVDFNKSLFGNYYRNDGIITLGHLIAFLLIIVLFLKKESIVLLLKSLSAGSFLVSISSLYLNLRIAILKDFSIPNFNGISGSFFGNPVFLAGFLVVTLPFIFYFIFASESKKKKLFFLIMIVMQILAIIATRTWAGSLGIILFLILISFYVKNSKKYLLFFLFTPIFLVLLWFYFRSQNELLERARINNPTLIIAEDRARIIRKGVMGYLEKPFFGWGWANFDYAFESVDWPLKIENDIYVDKAHSMFLEILVTTGVVGFIFYLLITARAVNNLWLNKNSTSKVLLVSLILYLFHSQTNIISISEEIIYWLVIGYSAKRY